MRSLITRLALGSICLVSALAQNTNPFLGRWDFNVGPNSANWLGVRANQGALEIRFQPTGGNVYDVRDYKLEGSHLRLSLGHNFTWDLEAAGDRLTGIQKRDGKEISLSGVRAPALDRAAPAAWSNPEALFNGKDLAGWERTAPAAVSHWSAREGDLVNETKGANLKTTRKFDDFKLHIEYNCPNGGNSGVYLRGRYEVQIEYEPLTQNPPERRMGSIYGFLTPALDLPRTPGQWETYDITLVGRTVTVVRDGKLTIDHQEIPGITGGALDANEGEPGPIYLQGDHTGGLHFRDITISLPRR